MKRNDYYRFCWHTFSRPFLLMIKTTSLNVSLKHSVSTDRSLMREVCYKTLDKWSLFRIRKLISALQRKIILMNKKQTLNNALLEQKSTCLLHNVSWKDAMSRQLDLQTERQQTDIAECHSFSSTCLIIVQHVSRKLVINYKLRLPSLDNVLI